ncbi:uncharacterized protein CG45076-like isoform X2 [Euwallacea fornicatus]|uniref:uncharacterized protein CG45076-like isoform X2 n=1 Tax=Euwallacea fornicatus TaxID=995702 RepID=UPI00339020E7
MVYESDFYTTRRPYRSTPGYSSYTSSYEPSRQVRILPGLGKVHIVHSYDRIVPYVGHKRLTVVTSPPRVWSTTPSVLHREYDWIERKVRPSVGYSAVNRYLNSDSAVRVYYSSYPISSSYYSTLSLPSSTYYPKLYRWYYDWPRTYSTYWPSYYWPSRYSRSYWPSYYWPYSYSWPYYRSYLGSYFRNYYLSYLPSLYYRSLDYEFNDLENKISNLSRMIYLNYPYRTLDYYPDSTRYYRPLTCYYNYYYPVRSLNYYSDIWPYYPYYRYLYYKYTLPSDRYYHLKGRIIYLPSPVSGQTYRVYPTAPYVRNKIYKPLGLYCDYYEPIRSLYWNSSYWPLYRSASSFVDQLPSRGGSRLQKVFDNETSLIRAETNALLRRVHDPVPRIKRLNWPLSTVSRYYSYPLPARYTTDYIHKVLVPVSDKSSYTTYYTEPVRKYIGAGHLASVSYAGGRAYDRRPYIYMYENPLQSDIQLLSYYINKFKQEKAYNGDSPKARPSRKFGSKNTTEEDAKQVEEMRKLREAREARLAFIHEEEKKERLSASKEVEEAVRVKKEKEDAAKLAEERALAEEQVRQQALAKEAARKADLARQEELAAQAAAERAAELEKQAEAARKEEAAKKEAAKKEEAKKKAEAEKKRQEEEAERVRLEEQRKIEEAKAEEALQAQLRLEEIARQAEEEREAELARQAEELAELARQEAELAEQAKREAEEEEQRRQEAELEQLRREEAELAELERQEKELAEAEEAAKQEAEEAKLAKEQEEAARLAAEQEELDREQAELEELERAQAELDALEADAKAMESDLGPPPAREEEPEAEGDPEPEPEENAAELAKQAELEELRRQEEELAELERAQAELDALEAEAKAIESDLGPPPTDFNGDDEDDKAIAEDVPGEQSDEGED